jgi:hypothetical protein
MSNLASLIVPSNIFNPSGSAGRLKVLDHRDFRQALAVKHGLEQQILLLAFDEPRAKLREDGKIKASILSFEAKGLLPIQTSPHGMSCLAIG